MYQYEYFSYLIFFKITLQIYKGTLTNILFPKTKMKLICLILFTAFSAMRKSDFFLIVYISAMKLWNRSPAVYQYYS